MNKVRVALLAWLSMTTLLVVACGLEGDLYIPEEKTKAATPEDQTTEEQDTNESGTDEEDKTNPSSAPAP